MKESEPKDIDELAQIHEGLGHPMRVAALLALRKEKRMLAVDLRRAVAALYTELDSKNLQFHLFKMQMAGIVSVKKEGGKDVVELVRDVQLRLKEI
ncbi:MAG: hypothetical protein WDA16_06390 [Candidatus Thermoplasmatota archaeon]